jgi:hypothetical protein
MTLSKIIVIIAYIIISMQEKSAVESFFSDYDLRRLRRQFTPPQSGPPKSQHKPTAVAEFIHGSVSANTLPALPMEDHCAMNWAPAFLLQHLAKAAVNEQHQCSTEP